MERGKPSVRSRTKRRTRLRFEQLDTEHMAPLLEPTLGQKTLRFFLRVSPFAPLCRYILHFCSNRCRSSFLSPILSCSRIPMPSSVFPSSRSGRRRKVELRVLVSVTQFGMVFFRAERMNRFEVARRFDGNLEQEFF